MLITGGVEATEVGEALLCMREYLRRILFARDGKRINVTAQLLSPGILRRHATACFSDNDIIAMCTVVKNTRRR